MSSRPGASTPWWSASAAPPCAGWRVYYLQNGNAEDVAYKLQMAFTPNNVTAVPKSQQGGGRAGILAQSAGAAGGLSGGLGGSGAGTGGASGGFSTGAAGTGALGGALGSVGGTPTAAGSGTGAGRTGTAAAPGQAAVSANPLLGGLEPGGSGGQDLADGMRVLPDEQNNALLVYGTAQETDTVEAMLRKIDILPLQVRIDAVIAEVTLNDQLQYGTQFFFKAGGINAVLNNAAVSAIANPNSVALGTTFPGFLLSGNGLGGAPMAISALQAVTTVNVLSSPQLLVVDNEPARLQVGSLVPYLTASAQSTIAANAPVVNSVGYQPTGVIMDITPRVNSSGLVTLDITQEVSSVDNTSPKASGIDSPTFQQRVVSSRVVVQDGQTIGIAGLIQDSASRGNQGIPWLKDIPLLGALAGTQNNQRDPHRAAGAGDPACGARPARGARAHRGSARGAARLRPRAARTGQAAGLGVGRSAGRAAPLALAMTPRRRQRGMVLLVVLWTIAVLALIGSHITATARAAAARVGALRAGAVAGATAEGLLREAIFRLLDTSPRRWTADGVPRPVTLPRGAGEVLITAKSGRINPNFAPVPLLLALLRAVGVPQGRAAALAGAIAEWHMLGTPNATAYLAARLPYLPARAPFRDLAELGLVAGMTPSILAALAPHLSVYSDGRVDAARADPLVLRVLQAVAADQRPAGSDAGAPQVLRISARAVLPDGAARREAVVRIDLTEDEVAGMCEVLAWE